MIKLRQNPYIGGIMMLVGLGLVGLGLGLGETIFYILAGVQLLLGILWLTIPVVTITQTHFEIKNLLGMTKARYEHGGLKNIIVGAPYVYIQRDGKRAQVRGIKKNLLHAGDWGVMERMITKL